MHTRNNEKRNDKKSFALALAVRSAVFGVRVDLLLFTFTSVVSANCSRGPGEAAVISIHIADCARDVT